MNVDDFLFGLILCGIGLAAACFRSEYLHLRELVGAERRRQKVIRELQLERLSAQAGNREHAARGAATQTAVMNAAQLMIDEVARPEDA
jgi:hypothetical protein